MTWKIGLTMVYVSSNLTIITNRVH